MQLQNIPSHSVDQDKQYGLKFTIDERIIKVVTSILESVTQCKINVQDYRFSNCVISA